MPAPKVALVIQRFGMDIVGGAESHARLIAEHLKRDAGYDVEVYTSTSRDYRSWDDSIPSGTHREGGLVVHRFSPRYQRGLAFKIVNGLLKLSLKFLRPVWQDRLESKWTELQGPFVPELLASLVRSQDQYDAVIFFTYLYYPTLIGLPLIKRPTILVPTAHDERAFYMRKVHNLLQRATWIFANTRAEADLIQRAHKIDPAKLKVVGLGIETPQAIRIPDVPEGRPMRLLYLGRIGPAKAVDEMIRYFQEALANNPSIAAELCIAGPLEGIYQVPSHDPRIQYLGVLNEAQKAAALYDADIVINPSHFESLSLLVLEGILAQKLIIVQMESSVLKSYAMRYPTVLGYRTGADFAQILCEAQNLLRPPNRLVTQLNQAARDVAETYSWDRVLRDFRAAIPH